MKRKNQHEWDFMGYDKETYEEYSYCDLCKTHRAYNPSKKEFRIITSKEYQFRIESGKVAEI